MLLLLELLLELLLLLLLLLLLYVSYHVHIGGREAPPYNPPHPPWRMSKAYGTGS